MSRTKNHRFKKQMRGCYAFKKDINARCVGCHIELFLLWDRIPQPAKCRVCGQRIKKL